MSLRIKYIIVWGNNGRLTWTAEAVQKICAEIECFAEDSNADSFIRAADAGTGVVIEDFRWTGYGTRDLEPLQLILSLCNEAEEVVVVVWWDDGTPQHRVWPVED